MEERKVESAEDLIYKAPQGPLVPYLIAKRSKCYKYSEVNVRNFRSTRLMTSIQISIIAS